MATKSDIITELSLLSLERLELLQAYSKFIIVPTEDLLTDVNMLQMREKIIQLGQQYFPEWTDQTATDFGMFLAELMCVSSEKDFWYINAFAEQTLLSKMRLYSAAFIRSTELGYRPATHKGSTGSADFIFPPGAAYTYNEGELIVETDDDGMKFTNITPVNVPFSGSSSNVNSSLRQGEYFKENTSFNGRSIDIRRKNVDIDTLQVRIDGILWTRVEIFGQSGSASTHYMVLPEDDGKCSIFFGDNTYGVKPRIGASCDLYFVCSDGALGNFNTNKTIKISKQNSLRPTTSVAITNTGIGPGAQGGINAPSISQIQNETVNYFNYREACINQASTLDWLLNQPEVGNGFVIIAGNSVNIYFLTKLGANPTVSEQNVILNRLTPLLVNGYFAFYNNTAFVNSSTTTVTASYLQGYEPSEIVSQVKQIIQDYTDPLIHAEYGGDYDLTTLSNLCINNIPGLQNLIFNVVAGVAPANIVVAPSQILSKIALGNITVNTVAI